MSTISGYDAAYPPSSPPKADSVVMGYLGGNTPHVWSKSDWDSQPARYRVGIWTRSNPGGYNGTTEAQQAVDAWRAVGAPVGTLIALDLELAQDAGYVDAFVAECTKLSTPTIDYGSLSTLFGNPPGSAGYWPSDPGATALYDHASVVATQTAIGTTYDPDILLASLPLWDTQQSDTTPPTEQEPAMPYVASVTPDPTGGSGAGMFFVEGTTVTHLTVGSDVTNLTNKFGVVDISPALYQVLVTEQAASASAIQAAVQAGVVAGLSGANVTVQGGLTQAQAQAAFTAALATLTLTETSTLTATNG